MNNHKTPGEWKTKLTMAINFISPKDSDDTRTTNTKSNDIEIMVMIQMKSFKKLLNLFCKDIKKY